MNGSPSSDGKLVIDDTLHFDAAPMLLIALKTIFLDKYHHRENVWFLYLTNRPGGLAAIQSVLLNKKRFLYFP